MAYRHRTVSAPEGGWERGRGIVKWRKKWSQLVSPSDQQVACFQPFYSQRHWNVVQVDACGLSQ